MFEGIIMARKLKHFVVHFWLASPRLNVPLLRLRHWVGKDKNFDIMIWYSALGTRISFFLTIKTFFQNQRLFFIFFRVVHFYVALFCENEACLTRPILLVRLYFSLFHFSRHFPHSI